MKKAIIIFGLILIGLFLFGCLKPEGAICEKAEVVKMLNKYPGIELKSMQRLSEEDFEKERTYWEEKCGIKINSGAQYKAIYEEDLVKLEVLAEPSKLDIICIIENLKTPVLIETPEPDINQIITPTASCTEDWECSDWNDCENEEQGRICIDLNDCGSVENKPVEVQTCEEDCEELWVCFDWSECINGSQTRNCEKLNDCDLNTTQETQRAC
jgi:hypothetical protein